MLKIVVGAALSIAIATTAFAQFDPDAYFGITDSFVDPDDLRGTDRNGFGLDLIIGSEMLPWLSVEGQVSFESHKTLDPDVSRFYRIGGGVDTLFLLGDQQSFTAFALAGIGGGYYDTRLQNTDEDISFYYNVGAGLFSPPFTAYGVRLRFEGRYREDGYGPGVTDYRFGLGFILPLRPPHSAIAPIALPVAPPAPPAPPAAPVAPEQSYGDTFPPRPVDRDQDGVLDNFDNCPTSAPGTLVDASGCRVQFQAQDLSLEGVSFHPGSDRLTAESTVILDQTAETLKSVEEKTVTIAGHTDSQGDENYNLGLSLSRANAVKRYLTQRGIAASRLKSVGYGESQPIASNETANGRARNRRVELRLDSGYDPK